MSTGPRKRHGELRWGILFIFPWIVGFLVFVLFPLLFSLYYSFTNYNLIGSPAWTGIKNYTGLLSDNLFYISLWNTIYMVILGLPLHLVGALIVALMLSANVKGLAVYRAIYYLPSVIPLVAAALLWRWIFNPMFGILNAGLSHLGLPQPGWLIDPVWSKPALILMGFWGIGGSMVLYLASIKDVPKELYEVADIDGANWLQKILRITLPMISPIIFFNLITGVIGYFQYFTQAYVLSATGYGSQMQVGGPRDSTMFYALYLYINAFRYFAMGKASAMAWILFVILMISTLVIFRSSARWVYYGGETRS